MSYATYITRAIVCGSRDSYTSDRSYLLFTERAGMVWASARSVRVEKSKQRYALQDFSTLRVSLVKGRSGWRIGSAEARGNPFMAATDRTTRGSVANIIKLLRRYVHGEGAMARLYNDTDSVLSGINGYSLDEQSDLVSIFQLRLLHTLGYLQFTENLESILNADTTIEAHTIYDKNMASAIKSVTDTAVNASHL